MERVTSADGTEIAIDRGGTGPPLVLVHGTASDHRSWSKVLPALRERFTAYAMDRRGRGESGDADDYAIEREFEDVAAVCAAAAEDGRVNLLGHSYGAVCSIGAAPRIPDLERLVLYEPPLWTEARPGVPADLLSRMEALAERGDGEAILETYWGEVIGDPGRMEALRSSPDFERRVAAAVALPREVRGRLEYRPEPADVASVTAPVRFLLGTETADALVSSTGAARELFPGAELVELPGQGHGAMHTAPEQLVSRVVEFLEAGAGE